MIKSFRLTLTYTYGDNEYGESSGGGGGGNVLEEMVVVMVKSIWEVY